LAQVFFCAQAWVPRVICFAALLARIGTTATFVFCPAMALCFPGSAAVPELRGHDFTACEAQNSLAPPGLEALSLGALAGFTAPPGLAAPPGFNPPPGLSLPAGFRAPPGLCAPDEDYSDASSDRCSEPERVSPVREWNSQSIIKQLRSKAKGKGLTIEGLSVEFR